jgi:hypothetical protein
MDWRSWSRREKALLRDLALMLAVMLVVGVYFLERLETRLEVQQRQHLQALTAYLAADSADYLSAGNHVSLGVIARQAAGLDTVATLVVRDVQGRVRARSGPEQSGAAPVQQAAKGENGPVGRLDLWPAAATSGRDGVEAGFVLVVLLLLALRILAEVIRRQFSGAASTPVRVEDPGNAGEPAPQPASAQVVLLVEPDRLEWLRERYTRSALNARLAGPERLLDQVVTLYEGERATSLDAGARVVFSGPRPAEAAFRALCAGLVFLLAVQGRASSGREREQGFRLLLSSGTASELEWPQETQTGVVYVPAREAHELALDQCALYRSEDGVYAGEIRLEAIARLSEQYQHLVVSQADKLAFGALQD